MACDMIVAGEDATVRPARDQARRHARRRRHAAPDPGDRQGQGDGDDPDRPDDRRRARRRRPGLVTRVVPAAETVDAGPRPRRPDRRHAAARGAWRPSGRPSARTSCRSRPGSNSSAVTSSFCSTTRGPARGDGRLHRETNAGLDGSLTSEDAMERDPMERDQGGSDVGRDLERDLGDEPPPAIRDAAPDYLAPIDDGGARSAATRRRPTTSASAADTPEHDWEHARDLIYPAFRPVGTQGLPVDSLDRDTLAADGRRATPSRSSTRVRPGCRSSTRSMPARSTSSSTATTCCRGASSRPSCRTRRCATWPPGRP